MSPVAQNHKKDSCYIYYNVCILQSAEKTVRNLVEGFSVAVSETSGTTLNEPTFKL